MDQEVYMGELGEKKKLFLKLTKKIIRDDYTVHKLKDRQNREAMFYNYKGLDFEVEDCILVEARIKDFRSYKQVPFTYLNYVKVLENKGNPDNPKDEKLT